MRGGLKEGRSGSRWPVKHERTAAVEGLVEERMILLTRPGAEPAFTLTIDLDQRCLLFPDGKVLTQLRLSAARSGSLTIEALFSFQPDSAHALGGPELVLS